MFILVLLALGVYGITVFANGSTSGLNVSGKLDITENGIYDISDKEYVDVDVAVPDNYVDPDGTLLLSSNGLYNVETYESVNVNIDTDVILDVEELPYIGYKGTTVPNSGFIENVYVNTDLSIDYVLDLIFNIDFITINDGISIYPILFNESKNFMFGFVCLENVVYFLVDIYNMMGGDMDFSKCYGIFTTDEQAIEEFSAGLFIGWNSDFNGIIEINENVLITDEEITTELGLSDYFFGVQNEQLSSLVSISEFEFIESDFKKDILYRCDDILYCFLDNKFVKVLTSNDIDEINSRILVKNISSDGSNVTLDDVIELYNAELCYITFIKDSIKFILPLVNKVYVSSAKYYLLEFGSYGKSVSIVGSTDETIENNINVTFSIDSDKVDSLRFYVQIQNTDWIESSNGYFYATKNIALVSNSLDGGYIGGFINYYDNAVDDVDLSYFDIKLLRVGRVSDSLEFVFVSKDKPTSDYIDLYVFVYTALDNLG